MVDYFNNCDSRFGKYVVAQVFEKTPDYLDVNGDGNEDVVVLVKEKTYTCPKSTTISQTTQVSFEGIKDAKELFFLSPKNDYKIYLGNVVIYQNKKFVVMDVSTEDSITWDGRKAKVDRGKIKFYMLPVETYKKNNGVLEEAYKNGDKKSYEKAMEDVKKNGIIAPLSNIKLAPPEDQLEKQETK